MATFTEEQRRAFLNVGFSPGIISQLETQILNASSEEEGASKPEGAVWLFPFASAAAADDEMGDNGDLCILLDTGDIIQKADDTWATE